MQEEKRKETEVVFGNPEEIDKRREQAKQFRTATERNYLLRDEYEKSRNLIDIMFMEGLPESFIEGIRLKKTDKAYVLTLDFLHCAALVMGCDYVLEKIQGQTINLEDAVDAMRAELQNQQLAPFRDVYENLDEKIAAALKGESMIDQQIQVLKMQNEHLEELYRERLESAKTRFNYQLRLSVEKAKAKETMDAQQIRLLKEKLEAMDSAGLQKTEFLSDRLRTAEEEKRSLQKGNESLEEEKKSLQEENRSLKEEKKSLQENGSLEEDKKSLQEENRSLEEEKRKLQGKNESLKEEKKTLQEENKSLKAEKKTLQEENESLKEEKKSLREGKEFLKGEKKSLQEENDSLKAENRTLQKNILNIQMDIEELRQRAEIGRRWFWVTGKRKEEPQDGQQKETVKSPIAEPPQEKEPDTKNQEAEDRRDFCLRILRDRNYTEEQMDLILKLMINEEIPKETLAYICNPALPVHNMKALVRYLERGEKSEKTEGK